MLRQEDRDKLNDEKDDEIDKKKFDQLLSDEEKEEEDDATGIYGVKRKVKKKKVKTRLEHFSKKLVQQPKGSFHVQKTSVPLTETSSCNLYLHAVNDSKVVFRLSNYYAAQPKVRMNFTLQESNSSKKVKKSLF